MDVDGEALFGEWEDDTIFNDLHYFHDDLESGCSNQLCPEQKSCYGQMDNDLDYAIAMSLQMEFNDEVKKNANTNSEKSETSKPLSIVDEQWELIDPHPDIHALFVEYDEKFFYGKLKSVEVRWSPRMTLCAGICSYQGRGGLCSIGLSEPLLKLRPRRDLVETLLHEMIHAYLFVTQNNKDREGHGPEFLSHMHRINKETGTRITVYHSFHAEVNLYKQHWWKCDGPCRNRSPYFGIVKRVMNRAPGPNDNWWAAHQLSCGGKFVKIKEPSNFSGKKIPKRKIQSDSKSKPSDIRKFIKVSNPEHRNKGNSQPKVSDIESPALCIPKSSPPKKDSNVINVTEMPKKQNFIPFQGTGHKLGSSSGITPDTVTISLINLKGLHFECKKDLPPGSFGNTEGIGDFPSHFQGKALIKRTVPSNSIGKALTKGDLLSHSPGKALITRHLYSSSPRKTVIKKDLFSSSPRKVPIQKDLLSSLPGKPVTAIPFSTSAIISRMSNASQTQNLQKGLDFSASASLIKTKKPETSVAENNLPTQHNSDHLQESCVTGTNFSSSVSTKLYCPVCSNLVSEEINAHIDKCLKNSAV